MNNFNDGGFKRGSRDSGGRSKFGGNKFGGNKRDGGNFGGGRDRGGRASEMFTATCSACHKDCEVPFRPSGDKPVYCSACFGKMNQDESRGDRGGDRRGGRNERPDYTKLPRDQRPPRHDKSRGQDDGGLADVKRQLITIESRLNRILDLLNPPTKPGSKTEMVADSETAVLPKKIPKVKTSDAKKIVDTPALKKVLNKVTKATPAKKVTKKATKKVTKKATKKATKKIVKKASKKASK